MFPKSNYTYKPKQYQCPRCFAQGKKQYIRDHLKEVHGESAPALGGGVWRIWEVK